MTDTDEIEIRRVPDANRVAVTIVAAVGEVTDTDPLRLPPLGDVVDPDSLNHLFSDTATADQHGGGYVTFEFAGCIVIVGYDNRIVVFPEADAGLTTKLGTGE